MSRPVILYWRRNSFLTTASDRLLTKGFTVNLFNTAVNITIFLSIEYCLSFAHKTNSVFCKQASMNQDKDLKVKVRRGKEKKVKTPF